MFCPKCAHPVPQGQRLCRNCGISLEAILNAKFNAVNSRKLSLQKGMLSIFSGGALLIALKKLLDVAFASGLLNDIERIIRTDDVPWAPVPGGISQVLHFLWLFALIPIARGVAHLINGVFFAPEPESASQNIYIKPSVQPQK
jgi:hypothetical protein